MVDFFCHEEKLVIEVDGGQHAEKRRYDEARTAFLNKQGLKVIRFWDNEVLKSTESVLEVIWNELREPFFLRAELSIRANEVEAFLTQRLNRAYDRFLELLPENSYVTMDENTWHLSADSIEKLDSESERRLLRLKDWLSQHMREIKLPDPIKDKPVLWSILLRVALSAK